MELGIIVIIITLLLILFRVPVAVAFAAPSIIYVLVTGTPVTIVGQRMVHSLNSYTILAVPLFIYVGSLLNHGGITDKIFDFANEMIGHISGGLAQVNITASLIFSGMSGAALADVGGLGRILIHAMEENGYPRDYSAALTSVSATIGPIFPPSIPLIIYGLVAEVSIIALFMAGVVPALICTVLLGVASYIIARRRDFPTQESDKTFTEKSKLFFIALPALLTPVVLIVGMLSGAFGPTELAAVTVIYVLLINLIIYKNRSSSYVFAAAKEAAHTTGVILFILAGAALFSWVISVEGVPRAVGAWLVLLTDDPLMLLLLINILLLIIGLFLETIAAILITTPIFLPPLVELGVDPVHFGVILVFNLMIGLVTPPLGLSLFVSSDIADVPVEKVIKQVLVYYVPLLLTLMFIVLFPELFLWTLDFV